jgi:cytochrome oxidase Cu insertion factor (SCO1/SenC/PrrC family)
LQLFQATGGPLGLLGAQAPPLQATLWVNGERIGNVSPVSGKPTLIVFTSASCGDGCYVQHAIVRRLVAKYERRGFHVTYVVRTGGYFRNQLVTPDTEMVRIKEYYADYLKLPVSVAIWRSTIGKRDDGQIVVQPVPNEEAYRHGGTYLVDRNGTIRLITSLRTRENEAMVDHLIESLL